MEVKGGVKDAQQFRMIKQGWRCVPQEWQIERWKENVEELLSEENVREQRCFQVWKRLWEVFYQILEKMPEE